MKKLCQLECKNFVCGEAEFIAFDLVDQGCVTDVDQNPRKCKKMCKSKCTKACMDRPKCPEPQPEDCANPAQTTPIHCANGVASGGAGKDSFCTDAIDLLCSRSCGLCVDEVARFESCDGARTTHEYCRLARTLTGYEKDRYCTAFTQKQCPVSCMGASADGEQCPE